MKMRFNGRFDGIGVRAGLLAPSHALTSRPTPMMQTIAGMPQIKLLTTDYCASDFFLYTFTPFFFTLTQRKLFYRILIPACQFTLRT
ncbi:MAG: hypothetical protein ACLUIR_03145 [Faecalibacterium prausnitzii]